MIAALLVLALLGWGCWWLHHAVRAKTAVSEAGQAGPDGKPRTRGLEDNSEAWPSRGPWSALDDIQLIRMLAEAAPAVPPARDSTEASGP